MKKMAGTWVVAVSGGSDSMALLDMCYQAKMDIVVAHVNYQKRSSASRDEKGVESYCWKRGIPFFKHVVEHYDSGNFQAQARKIRYSFFKEIIEQVHAKGVLVAHHLDDVLETYIMQKKRKSIPEYYGIKDEVIIYGVMVKRLLLSYNKKELEMYCDEHAVPYFYDESNDSDVYTRNRVRHEQIVQMNVNDKENMLKCICKENLQLQKNREKVMEAYKDNDGRLIISHIMSYPKAFSLDYLRYWIVMKTGIKKVSRKTLEAIYNNMEKSKNWTYPLSDIYQLCCDYGEVTIEKREALGFSYQFTKLEYIETSYFKICQKGEKIEGVLVDDKDFPITIRNYRPGDRISLRYGSKKVSRFLIDRKISRKERQLWPVLVNNMGEIIFVCGIGCDIAHYGNNFNMFVVK
ncbi:tRNA(Ile)-lysidine synthetase-like protein [Breznakia sp. PF5-3]|uniref:tRNA lysidine(34) synthetase TilS n=1 Tax=unclassified Breznakia TaxID=2623764 RepID=UPI0024050637|nr:MULTISPECIES: tRNA lysidine(34) synthetase TilS [unclassified Breznakia]MDF9824951.1 tRNA(Ile)-lysidine synthetase-like protein [Breznakia sp. PM6-1]MDF9835781.1 tRNA(Ile)-lysidine synthetase-like protein [Breznakia sp. PF5-3]MDF9837925.1 tRNA(Ile)-lysidine synthetase-like protein [Breznakia sp. PFB2-8]MDF9859914.1 tRNA(Ile)-lysidine synthetase-like protein [Breznakia sp. PH5-24]